LDVQPIAPDEREDSFSKSTGCIETQRLYCCPEKTISSGIVRAETHPKYLLDPGLVGRVSLVEREFDVSQVRGGGLMRSYEGPRTLGYLKRNADRFSPDENAVVHANPDVLDLEVGLPHSKTPGAQTPSDRIDIAALEADGDAVRLVFWEAKPNTNRDLWPDGTGRVRVLE
jgi:hypothetical protein